MLIKQVILKTLDDHARNALKELEAIGPNIIFIFGHISFFQPDNASRLTQLLQDAFPTATSLGCSTAGEIVGKRFEEESLVITAMHSDSINHHASAALLNTMQDSAEAGHRLASQLPADTQAVIVLAPGINVNGSALISGMKQSLPPHVPLTGGLAGDSGAFAITYTLLNGTISDRQAVALSLSGEKLRFYHGSFGGWQPFGPARKITRCENNILYELDGEPAISVYKHYLGEHAKGLPATSLLFPLAILDDTHQETGLIRTILGIDEQQGTLILAGDIQNNTHLKLMHASTSRLVEGATTAAEAVMNMHHGKLPDTGLALLISCVGRKLVMGDRVDEELETVADVLPPSTVLSGFYSYGEISPHNISTDCKLHNQTMTITYISEL